MLSTLQTTVLDRNVAKSWMRESGVYNNLLSVIYANDPTVQQQMTAISSAIPQQTVTTSLNQSFSPAYVQTATETILDSTYDWLDGKQPSVTFDINTTTQKSSFTSTLASLLEPQIAALPQCASLAEFNAQNPTCRPPGITPEQLSQSAAIDIANQASVFQQPLTDTGVTQAAIDSQTASPVPSSNPATQSLPSITANIRLWLILLPVIAIVSGGGMVLLSHRKYRLNAAKHLAGRLTIGLGLTMVIGILLMIYGKTISISGFVTGANKNILSQIVEPILHVALPAVGNRLAWVSGLLAALTLAIWITLRIIKKRRDKLELHKPIEAAPAVQPTAPVQTKTQASEPPKSNNQ